jgi:hypothetical protein
MFGSNDESLTSGLRIYFLETHSQKHLFLWKMNFIGTLFRHRNSWYRLIFLYRHYSTYYLVVYPPLSNSLLFLE